MKRLVLAGLLATSVALSGCAAFKNATPEQTIALVKAFGDAGCRGHVHGEIGASTGQLGGEAHVGGNVDGDCDPANRPKPAAADTPADIPPAT